MTAPTPLNVFTCDLAGINLIEASAGTGKTWSICALYARLIVEAAMPVESILVVTFTNAATAELRDRLRAQLSALARGLARGGSEAGSPFVTGFIRAIVETGRVERDLARRRIQLALAAFDEAAVFTIHGFCQRALSETPFSASMPFAMEILNDDSDITREVAADFWRAHVAGPGTDAAFAAFLVARNIDPDWFLRQLKQRLRYPLARIAWPTVTRPPEMTAGAALRCFDEARGMWEREKDAIITLLAGAKSALNQTSYKESIILRRASDLSVYFSLGSPFGLPKEKDDLQFFGATRLDAKKKKEAPPSHPFFALMDALARELELLARDCEARLLSLRMKLLDEAPAELGRRKLERRVLSYDDMLSNLYRALNGTDGDQLAATLRAKYPCALIDEFQDTDPVQLSIFQAVYARPDAAGPLFLVGDPKQAIYSFRGADIHTYIRARELADTRYTLAENQRSSRGLIDACNALYAGNPRAFMLDGLAYHPVSCSTKPRASFEDRTEFRAPLQVWELPAGSDDVLPDKRAAQALAADATAAEIARLLAAGRAGAITLDGRGLRASHIAVLARTHREGRLVRRALSALGIGSVELSQLSVWMTPQADETLRILRAVAEPGNVGAVRSALATEIFGATAEDLHDLNVREQALEDALSRFRAYHAAWRDHGFAAMWRAVLRSEGAMARIAGLREGERKLTNVLHLGELIQAGAAAHAGMNALMRHVEHRIAARNDASDDEQMRLESDDALVHIVTIHKAKGLEYPVVFLPFMFDGWISGSEPRGMGILTHQNGDALLSFPPTSGADKETKQAASAEIAEERMRQFYVALTRAIHRCYLITGAYASRNKDTESLSTPVNWLVAGADVGVGDFLAGAGPQWPAIAAAWRRLADGSAGGIAVDPLPAGGAVPPGEREAREIFAAHEAAGPYASDWLPGSYTSLVGRRATDTAPDRDSLIHARSVRDALPPESLPAGDILRFPRGASAGECIHKALELADFRDPRTWDAAIATALRSLPAASHAEAGGAGFAPMLHTLLRDLCDAPMPGDLRLRDVGMARRLNELGFRFPSPRFTDRRLNELLRRHGFDQPPLSFAACERSLHGFIDCLFEHGGRMYIIDWKSNFLGYDSDAYGAASMAREMRESGYHLQYLIYTVAVHRYLGRRVAGYNYDDMFGGSFHMFVRGAREGWRDSDGAPCGVYHARPGFAVIEELEALIATPAEAGS